VGYALGTILVLLGSILKLGWAGKVSDKPKETAEISVEAG
jgi:hypothetical protein